MTGGNRPCILGRATYCCRPRCIPVYAHITLGRGARTGGFDTVDHGNWTIKREAARDRPRSADGRGDDRHRLSAGDLSRHSPGLRDLPAAGAAGGLASRPRARPGGGGRRRARVRISVLFTPNYAARPSECSISSCSWSSRW